MQNITRLEYADCPNGLDDELKEQYARDGFLAFKNALTPSQVEEARRALRQMIDDMAFNDEVAEYVAPPKGSYNAAGALFRLRANPSCFFQLERNFIPTPGNNDEIDIRVRKFMGFEKAAPIFEHIAFAESRIQQILRDLLGDNPLLFQSMALVKPPGGCEKPWHQDNAYFSTQSPDAVVGTWIALDEATVENGCMHFLPGGHHRGPMRHHHASDCEIVPGRLNPAEAIPVPLPAGGMVFFHGSIPHQTPPNASDRRRRALQFHYRAEQNAVVDRTTYDRIFTEPDGTPASCAAARPQNL